MNPIEIGSGGRPTYSTTKIETIASVTRQPEIQTDYPLADLDSVDVQPATRALVSPASSLIYARKSSSDDGIPDRQISMTRYIPLFVIAAIALVVVVWILFRRRRKLRASARQTRRAAVRRNRDLSRSRPLVSLQRRSDVTMETCDPDTLPQYEAKPPDYAVSPTLPGLLPTATDYESNVVNNSSSFRETVPTGWLNATPYAFSLSHILQPVLGYSREEADTGALNESRSWNMTLPTYGMSSSLEPSTLPDHTLGSTAHITHDG